MTERGRRALSRTPSTLGVGPSSVTWDGAELRVDIDEITVPLPSRLRGRVTLVPESVNEQVFTLDATGRHLWWPIAPCARIEVELGQPAMRWSGSGYLDANRGSAPLEDAFRRWDWCRAAHPDGALILYEVERRSAPDLSLALRCDRHGGIESFEPPPAANLPLTRWRVPRRARSEPGQPVAVTRTLEDTPFYARSMLATRLQGHGVSAVHESLDLDRFRSRWVQLLLPFRMPRRSGR